MNEIGKKKKSEWGRESKERIIIEKGHKIFNTIN